MPKWVKAILAVLLLPLCVGTWQTLLNVVKGVGEALNVWVPLASGAGCWVAIFLFLPRQAWLYVMGHEMTHVVWSWAFGGKLKQFKIGAKSGHVVVTKSNFLVALAPYFFPLYAIAVVLIFGIVNALWQEPNAVPVFHLLLGATYAFHVTWTWEVLRTRQSDISGQGYLFSTVVLLVGNLAVLILGIALLSGKPPMTQVAADWSGFTLREYQWCWDRVAYLFRGSA